MAKAWYVNVRNSIGIGKQIPVPPQLELGIVAGTRPAPSLSETMCIPITGIGSRSMAPARLSTMARTKSMFAAGRWQVDYPKRVSSSGGRYHFKDDWQFYDTLMTSFEYKDDRSRGKGRAARE